MNGPDLHTNPLDSLLAATAASGRSVPGALTALNGDVVEGWAYDPANPELRLVVEVYVDEAYVGITRADQEQPHGAPGDGFHGFVFQIRSEWLEKAKRISARIANQGPWLADSITLPVNTSTSATAPAPQVGVNGVRYGGGLRINGWAFEPANPGKVIEIRVREGDNVFAIFNADRPTPGLVYAHSAEHGFEFDLPWHLADGQPHIIYVETESGDPITGSPFTVCVRPEGLAHLLHTQLPRTMDAPTRELLIALAEQQARRFPGSCGFEHYAAWLKTFQQPLPLTPATQPTGRVAILLLDEPGACRADRERSLDSIQSQRLPSVQISVLSPNRGNLVSTLLEAVEQADLLVPLRMGDRLAPHAIDTLLTVFNNDPKATWGYADCDQVTDQGGRGNPWFKPAWDATLFESMDLVSPGGAFTARAIQGAAKELKPNSGWDALLQAIVAQTQDSQHVLHLPQVLYHRGTRAEALPTRRQASWPTPKAWPRVSLIVPTRDQLHYLRPCVDGLLHGTDYPSLEVIVVDNDSHEPDTLAYLAYLASLQQAGVKVLRYPHAFNYAAINNWAVEHANGEVIGLINNDIAVQEPGWLKAMVTQLMRPKVGAVGAKLLWPNGMVQHGGVVVGINQLAGHAGNTLFKDDPGYLGLNLVAKEQSAVTAACLLVAKADYQAIGGLDSDQFPVTFNDVDFCLKLCARGQKIVWTPDAVLTHSESVSRGKDDKPDKQARARREQALFIRKWQSPPQVDPYYHPALCADFLNGPYGALACPPAPLTPRL